MASHITTDDLQAWLSEDRHRLNIIADPEEEVGIASGVLSKLATRFDVSTWIDSSSTPLLVRTIISLLVASARLRKVYADQGDESNYADKLEEWANDYIMGLVEGTILLLDAAESLAEQSDLLGPSFLPDDSTLPVASFTMGEVF